MEHHSDTLSPQVVYRHYQLLHPYHNLLGFYQFWTTVLVYFLIRYVSKQGRFSSILFLSTLSTLLAKCQDPRVMLFTSRHLGCGATVIIPLIAMNIITESVIGTPLITSSIDVHQGSLTSCLQFVIFVNDLKMLIKEVLGQMVF